MVTVELFKGLPFNGSNKMSNFASATAQDNYFKNIPASDKLVMADVKFTKLSEPILLEKTVDELFPYTYGRMKLNDSTLAYNNWYYFSIDRYEVERTNKTWVYYIVDYWETYRYAHTAGSTNKLTIGRARISRCSLDLGCRIKGAYQSAYTKQKRISEIVCGPAEPMFPTWYNAIATYHDNNDDKNYVLTLASTRRMSDIIAFDWSRANIDPNQIMGLWFSPFPLTDYGTMIWTDTASTTNYNVAVFKMDFESFAYERESTTHHQYDVPVPRQPNERSKIGITDALGNLVWISDLDIIGPMKLCLNVTMTTARWLGYIQRDGVYTNGECMFTIPCEPMDLFSDAFVAYYTQQRPFTERQRQIQKDEALVNGIANTFVGTAQGATIGAMSGNPVGAIGGAVAGFIGNVAGTAIGYYSADDFNKRYQRNEDAQARMQTDNLRFEGCGLSDYAVGYTRPSFVEIQNDAESWQSYLNDLDAYGYFYDCEFTQLETFLASNPVFKLTCDCEIENVPAIAERSVKNRLSAGVQFIRP